MRTQRHKLFLSIGALLLCYNISFAQFGDWKPYPTTTAPSEKKDSTRGHVWGYMFGSMYTKLHGDSLKRGVTQYSQVPQGANSYSFQRVYLGYDYFFNKKFSAHMVLAHEEFYDGSSGGINIDQTNSRSFYLKYCNVEWDNIIPGQNLTVGAIVTPAFPTTEEPFWGYRSIERTIMDMRNIMSSNDVGANLGGKLWKKTDGNSEKACIGYNIMVGNGTSAAPDNSGILSKYTPYHRYYGNVYGKFLGDKVLVDLFGFYNTVEWSPVHQTDMTFRGLVGYKTGRFNLSFEYFQETMKNQSIITAGTGITSPDTTDRIQSGISIEGAVTLIKDKNTGAQKLGLLARYDMYNPDAKYNNNDSYKATYSNKETFFVVGLDYQPIPQIHVMPNIWYDGFSNQAKNVSGVTKSDYDMVVRVTLYYLFYK